MFRKLTVFGMAAGMLSFAVHGLVLTLAASGSAQQRAITVLVADLVGDPDAEASATQSLVDALSAVADVEAIRTGRLDARRPDAAEESLRQDRALLRSEDAALLIRGRRSETSGETALWLIARPEAVGMDSAHGGVRQVTLPPPATKPAAARLLAVSLSMLEPASSGQAKALAAAMLQAAEALAPESADAAEPGLHQAFGLALTRIAMHRRDLGILEQAAQNLGRAAALFERETAAVNWASAHSDLGDALAILGDQEQERRRLETAAASYRAALTVWSAEVTPLRWAGAQAGLGSVLTSLGAREGDGARYDEAIAAYRAAAPVLERLEASVRWAQVQNRIGAILLRRGIAETGTARLEQATEAFRAALGRQDRKTAPLDWAMTQSNLGTALANIGQREGGTAHLEEARAALTAAMTAFVDLGFDDHAQRVRWNLRRVEAVLEERQ